MAKNGKKHGASILSDFDEGIQNSESRIQNPESRMKNPE
jgi:hypothetical protein